MTAGLYVARNFLAPIINNLADPDKEKHDQTRQQAKAHLERINRCHVGDNDTSRVNGEGSNPKKIEDLALNEYENLVALEMVSPEDIHVGFQGTSFLQFQQYLRVVLTSSSDCTRYWGTGRDHRGA